MRPQPEPDSAASGSVRVEFQVNFTHGPRGARRVRDAEAVPVQQPESPKPSRARPRPEQKPRLRPKSVACLAPAKITRLLVLAHHFDALVRTAVVRDYAEVATRTGLSRARITQITNLSLLAPDIQEAILHLDDATATAMGIFERELRPLSAAACWNTQRAIWKKLLPQQPRG